MAVLIHGTAHALDTMHACMSSPHTTFLRCGAPSFHSNAIALLRMPSVFLGGC